MIFIFHGENQPALRQELLNLKSRYQNTHLWQEEGLAGITNFLAAPSFSSLGGGAELVVLENPAFGEAVGYFKAWSASSKDLAITFIRILKKPEISKVAGAKVFLFNEEIPQNVFSFLDAVAARNRVRALGEFKRLKGAGMDLDFLTKMLGWSFRNLAQVQDGEEKALNPYVASKLKRITSLWEEGDLRQAYAELVEEDQRQKKGRAVPFEFLVKKLTKA
ncbi:MAG: hypothetical protein WEC39_00470 [Patescibacteria group bacterium]